jgi:hypothetical protein
MVAVVVGNVIVVASVPAKVKLLLAVNVLLFAIVKVAAVAGAVKVTLLILVAEPIAPVTKAVVATAVVLFPAVCVVAIVPVGKVGVPVKVGEAKGAAPKLVSAAAAVVAPVPPFAMATVPDTLAAVPVVF